MAQKAEPAPEEEPGEEGAADEETAAEPAEVEA
jgi:hypothetical protein